MIARKRDEGFVAPAEPEAVSTCRTRWHLDPDTGRKVELRLGIATWRAWHKHAGRWGPGWNAIPVRLLGVGVLVIRYRIRVWPAGS